MCEVRLFVQWCRVRLTPLNRQINIWLRKGPNVRLGECCGRLVELQTKGMSQLDEITHTWPSCPAYLRCGCGCQQENCAKSSMDTPGTWIAMKSSRVLLCEVIIASCWIILLENSSIHHHRRHHHLVLHNTTRERKLRKNIRQISCNYI